jgi:membrane protein YqaA with SNARE-associated domain
MLAKMALALSLGALAAYAIGRMLEDEDEAMITRATEERLAALRRHLFRDEPEQGLALARIDSANVAAR